MKQCQKCNSELTKSSHRNGVYHCDACHTIYSYNFSEKNGDRVYLLISLTLSLIYTLKSAVPDISPWIVTVAILGLLLGSLAFMFLKSELVPYPQKSTSLKKPLFFALFNVVLIVGFVATSLMASKVVALAFSLLSMLLVLMLIIRLELKLKNNET